MDSKFNIIESKLYKPFVDTGINLFNSEIMGKKFIAELVKELQNNTENNGKGVFIAPHIFTLSISPQDMKKLSRKKTQIEIIAGKLFHMGESAGYTFKSNIVINLFPNDDLNPTEFYVSAIKSYHRDSIDLTEDSDPTTPFYSHKFPPKAFLIISGGKLLTLEYETISIGRKLDNHLIFDDPRVSRHHAQIKAIKGRYIIFDLKSSGGTFINGEKVRQAVLQPGDVISIAGVILVYGHESSEVIENSLAYEKPNKLNNNTTTIVAADLHLSSDNE